MAIDAWLLWRSALRGMRSGAGAVFSPPGELLCPPDCVRCAAPLEPGEYLCAPCAALARAIEPPFCGTCSQPFDGAISCETFSCSNCRESGFAFACAVSRYRSRDIVRDLILRFKHHGHHYLRRPLSRWLAEAYADERIRARPADALVPVPLHPRRLRERGFNQAEALCQVLGRRAGLPVWPTALRRVRHTEHQARLDRVDRLENLRGAFAANARQPVAGRHVLLVDDVLTTGSTFHECAGVLRRAGAASVRALAVARG